MAKQLLNLNANTKNLQAEGLAGLFSSSVTESAQPTAERLPLSKEKKNTVRQTFVLDAEDMDYILDLVYTRMIERGTFTQKEALVEIIRFHRDNNSDIKSRPNK
jgi:hypothetical protein